MFAILLAAPAVALLAGYFLLGGESAQDPTYRGQLMLLIWIAVFTAAVGVSAPVVIGLAGRAAAKDRRLLLKVFKPGVAATVILVCLLVLVHGGLVISTMVLAGVKVWKILGLIALGVVTGVFYVVKATLTFTHPAETHVMGRRAERNENPKLHALVDSLARRAGTEPPANVIVGLDPSFFVTESKVSWIGGEARGRTMYLSLTLCRILSVEELSAIIGHELGHFHGEDTQFSLHFYPIFRGASNALTGLNMAAESTDSWLAAIPLYPAAYVMGYFLESFSEAESKISRERELAADAFAANLTSSRAAATALVKVCGLDSGWSEALESLRGTEAANVAIRFAEITRRNAPETAFDGIDDQVVPHPTDSHPPLHTRLAAMGLSVQDVASEARQVSERARAIELFERPEEVEMEVSAIYHSLMNPEKTTRPRFINSRIEPTGRQWLS